MIGPLLLGAALAIAALLFVLEPLFDGGRVPIRRPRVSPNADAPSAVDALREIEFDRATGKLADADYAALRAEYTRLAVAELHQTSPEARSAAAAADALIERFRARRRDCETCGPRPESDAVFCSRCGRHLDGRCPHCGEPVAKPASRFCTACGAGLAV